MKLILASRSPRRAELMTMLGIPFEVICSNVSEDPAEISDPSLLVEQLAKGKADAVFKSHPNDCVIGCDTIVFLDGEILGKPLTPEMAAGFLKKLRGRTHQVFTGICIRLGKRTLVRNECTYVTFGHMSDAEIRKYVSSGEPFDKAGGYGIQGHAGVFIDSIHGNYFNVVGLPVSLLYRMLKDIGYLVPVSADE